MNSTEIAPGELGFSVLVGAGAAVTVAVLVFLITRTIVKVADKPPAIALTIVLSSIVVLLVLVGTLTDSSQAMELAGVGIGALAGAVTATWRPDDDSPPAPPAAPKAPPTEDPRGLD